MNPWDRRPEETKTQYDAFLVYLLLGPDRSIAKSTLKQGKSAKCVREVWSRNNDWVSRAEAYDAMMAAEALKARAEVNVASEIEKFRDRTRQGAIAVTSAALRLLNKIAPAIDNIDVEGLTPSEIASLSRAGATMLEFGLNNEAMAIGADRLAEAMLNAKETEHPVSADSQ